MESAPHLIRTVALDCDPVSVTAMGPVVPHRMLLRLTFVLISKGARRPAKAALKRRMRRMPDQVTQDRIAFVRSHTVDRSREAGVHIKAFSLHFRMHAHDRILGARILQQ